MEVTFVKDFFVYQAGDTIEMDDAKAKELLEQGVVILPVIYEVPPKQPKKSVKK